MRLTVCSPPHQLPSTTSVRTEGVWSAPWTMPFSLACGVVQGQMSRSLTTTLRLHYGLPISTCSRKYQKKHSVSFIPCTFPSLPFTCASYRSLSITYTHPPDAHTCTHTHAHTHNAHMKACTRMCIVLCHTKCHNILSLSLSLSHYPIHCLNVAFLPWSISPLPWAMFTI